MSDYHDYVIKNGEFIGRFEEMYRDCSDPWRQSAATDGAEGITRQAAITMLLSRGVRSVVEFGCGLGYYAEQLAAAGFDVTGVDVSPTAIDKARARRPDLRFAVDGALNVDRYPADAIVFSEITWYILPELQEIFERMRRHAPARFFAHVLTFYAPGVQRYGRDYFTSLEEFIGFCPLQPLEQVVHTSSAPGSTIGTASLFRIEPAAGQ